jgi:anti-anti-sigma factor
MSAHTLQLHDPIVRIAIKVQPPMLCVSIGGELDLSCCQLLEAVTHVDLEQITKVLIDLTELSFCDVVGFRAVAQLHDTQRLQQRTVQLSGAQSGFRRLAEMTGRTDFLAAN